MTTKNLELLLYTIVILWYDIHIKQENERTKAEDMPALVNTKTPAKTSAERVDSINREAARWARKHIEGADAAVTEAKQKLIDGLDCPPDYHRNRYIDYVIAQTKATIWRNVMKCAKADGVSLVDALQEVRDELMDELVNVRHESRSTSGLSDAIEDIERDAQSQWLRDLKYKLPQRGDTRYM